MSNTVGKASPSSDSSSAKEAAASGFFSGMAFTAVTVGTILTVYAVVAAPKFGTSAESEAARAKAAAVQAAIENFKPLCSNGCPDSGQ
jgi:hypothetical protein